MNKYVRVIINTNGSPSVLEVKSDNLPEPKAGEARVKVKAAGVGYSDVMAQRGGYPLAPKLPFTPGYDLTGEIDKLGENVSGLSEGLNVAALNPGFGCYAEYICIPAKYLVPFAAELDPLEVTCLILNYLTAFCILHKKARISSGQSVLVHSAAGGVGTALVQLGVLAGATVFGTASIQKHDLVKSMGAVPIDYKSRDFVAVVRSANPGGVDAAFDPIGGSHLFRSYQAVKSGGKLVSYGFAGDNYGGLVPMILGVAQIALLNMIPDGKRVSLCALPSVVKNENEWYKRALSEIIELYSQGRIKPVIGAVIPLSEAAKAHELIESGRATGKVILQCRAAAETECNT